MLRNTLIRRTRREGLLYQSASYANTKLKQSANLLNRAMRASRIRRYFSSHLAIKIQFGSGDTELPGFMNTDLFGIVPVDITRPLPFTPSSVDVFYSNHLIEHIYNREARQFLRNTFVALKPGGMHIVATPSLEKLARIVYTADDRRRDVLLQYHQIAMQEQLDPATFLNRMMHINYGHRFLYDYGAICRMATETGYHQVELVPNRAPPDESIRVSLLDKDECWDIETETYVLRRKASER